MNKELVMSVLMTLKDKITKCVASHLRAIPLYLRHSCILHIH